jgi:hypothetical protein
LAAEDPFTELTLRISTKTDGKYTVEISLPSVPGRVARGTVGPPPGGLPGLHPEKDSQRLTEWFFTDPKLVVAWAELRGGHTWRRIRLVIDTDEPELHTLPWELLAEADVNGTRRLLSADRRTPFSRLLDGDWEAIAPVREMPLRVLVAIANPDFKGSNYSELEPVSEESELRQLQDALFEVEGAGLVEIVPLPAPCTLEKLEDYLRHGYHVLHFLGHGAYLDKERQEEGQAVLYMADQNNKVAQVSKLSDGHPQRHRRLRRFCAPLSAEQRARGDCYAGQNPDGHSASVYPYLLPPIVGSWVSRPRLQ